MSPHILYYVSGNTLNRFNVRTMRDENTTPFPKTLSKSNIVSFSVSEGDVWFTMMAGGGSGVLAWNRQTDQQRVNSIGATDQYSTTSGGYMMVIAGSISLWNLATGAMEPTGLSGESAVEHPDGAGAFFVARNADTRDVYRLDPVTKIRATILDMGNHTNGSQHFSARWYQSTASTQWALGSFHGGDEASLDGFALHSGQIYRSTPSFNWGEVEISAVLQGSWNSGAWLSPATSIASMTEGSYYWEPATARLLVWQQGGGNPSGSVRAWDTNPGFQGIMFFRLDGSERRLLAHHFSSSAEYFAQPRAVVSPDGRLVMWTSDMNGSSRHDVFVAEVP